MFGVACGASTCGLIAQCPPAVGAGGHWWPVLSGVGGGWCYWVVCSLVGIISTCVVLVVVVIVYMTGLVGVL